MFCGTEDSGTKIIAGATLGRWTFNFCKKKACSAKAGFFRTRIPKRQSWGILGACCVPLGAGGVHVRKHQVVCISQCDRSP